MIQNVLKIMTRNLLFNVSTRNAAKFRALTYYVFQIFKVMITLKIAEKSLKSTDFTFYVGKGIAGGQAWV